MTQHIFINTFYSHTDLKETRVAILENGVLIDYSQDNNQQKRTRGNIYQGIVSNVEPSIQAAFVEFGANKHGFLSASDIVKAAYREGASANPRSIFDMVKRKQLVSVQVIKDEQGNKGAALTTAISIPGRYLVLTPLNETQGISRKIEDEDERLRIKSLTQSFRLPKGMGVIVRTAGMMQPKAVLQRDLRYLLRLWEKINDKRKKQASACLLYSEQDLIVRTLRDYLTDEVDKIVIDDEASYLAAKEFIHLVSPKHAKLIEFYNQPQSLFSHYGIESQIESLFVRKVQLPSGGSLVIDQAEALVAIDVNSGKMTSESNQAETAFRTNLEAVKEIARQLRLRDLGGIIVLDLIDMEKAEKRAQVEEQLREALKADKAKIKVGHISQNGILELTRQRIRSSLLGALTPCTRCEGLGLIRPTHSECNKILRSLNDRLVAELKPQSKGIVTLEVLPDIAHALLNDRRFDLVTLEQKYKIAIHVKLNNYLTSPFFAISFDKIIIAHATPNGSVHNAKNSVVSNVAKNVPKNIHTSKQPTQTQNESTPQNLNDVDTQIPPEQIISGQELPQSLPVQTQVHKPQRRRWRRKRNNLTVKK